MDNCSNNDIEIVRGDSELLEVVIEDEETGLPINITGYTIYFTVNKTKDASNDDDAVIKKDITSHVDPTHGITDIVLDGTDTNLAPGKYHYDVQYKDTDDNVKTVIIGNIIVIQDVTKRS